MKILRFQGENAQSYNDLTMSFCHGNIHVEVKTVTQKESR